ALFVNEESKFKQIVLIIMFLLFVISGLAGLSRALTVAVFASVLVYLIFTNKLRQYLKFIVIAFVSFIFMIYAFNDVVENLMQRFDGGINFQEEARTKIWKTYLANVSDYFWLGEIEGDYKKYTRW